MLIDKKSKEVFDNFIKLLERNGDLKKAKEIIQLAEKLYLKKVGSKKVTLESARKINSKDILKKILKEGDFWEEKINTDLIAGIKVIVDGEKQLNYSLKSKLDKIFSHRYE